ncbi:MAG: hypothetical protein ABIQ29_04320 [Burkholderiaceae bacterium]
MTLRLALSIAVLGLAGAAAGAASQQVYRCGPEGRVYSQTPCKDGYPVATDDARSAEQRKAALETVKTDAVLAERMTREREARERAAAQKGPTIIANSGLGKPAAAPHAAASAPAKKKPKRPPKSPTPQA